MQDQTGLNHAAWPWQLPRSSIIKFCSNDWTNSKYFCFHCNVWEFGRKQQMLSLYYIYSTVVLANDKDNIKALLYWPFVCVTGGFPSPRASNAENIFLSLHHHVVWCCFYKLWNLLVINVLEILHFQLECWYLVIVDAWSVMIHISGDSWGLKLTAN